MLSNNWNNIVDKYISWIKDNTFISELNNNTVKVTVPFLNPYNDHLEIYVREEGENTILLTDDGHTVDELTLSGMEINTPKREKFFRSTVGGYGVKIGDNYELYTEANLNNIGKKKHALIQAILAVNDMYVLSQESVATFFKEDVELYFASEDIIFTKDVKIAGKSGFDHNFDFIIPHTKSKPESLIKAINKMTRSSVEGAIFSYNDVGEIRDVETRNLVFFNDTVYSPSIDTLEALQNYNILGLPWSERDKHKEKLTLVN